MKEFNAHKITNADYINSMTNEEFAEFLAQFEICNYCEYNNNGRCTFENPCTNDCAVAITIKWLQSESKWQMNERWENEKIF